MKFLAFTLVFIVAILPSSHAQTILAAGEQPQVSVDNKGVVRLVFGKKDQIFYSTSDDNGKTFTTAVLVAQVPEMHLGMTRGPQLASSKDYSMVTAMDKKGNINCFRLDHKSGEWTKIKNVNNVDASAPEGLMSLAADNNNNFYAVWLDIRLGQKNNICFAAINGKKEWSTNKFAYTSPETHVCECCKPSVQVNGNTVVVMFRNWLMGSRDLYLTISKDKGKTFSTAQKLGQGTWPLKGCPMDGGGLSLNAKTIETAWQREGVVYHVRPGQPEQKIGEGRRVSMKGNIVTWENGSDLMVHRLNGQTTRIGEGTALSGIELSDKTILAIWEKNGEVIVKTE
jgi:hypothetical protein